jgi:hypothetical protein
MSESTQGVFCGIIGRGWRRYEEPIILLDIFKDEVA